MKLKERILSLVLSSALVISLAPTNIFAEEEQANTVKTATVEVSAQAEYQFIVPHHEITVSADKAESYGYVDNPKVEGDVTALDALVAMHEETYGDDFTKDTKSNYLDVNGGYVSKEFGVESYYWIFDVNGKAPHDGVPVEAYGGQCTMDAVNQAVLKDNDEVRFVLAQDTFAFMDYKLNVSYNGKKLNGSTFVAGVDQHLNVTGYGALWEGYPDEVIEENGRENVADVQLALVGEDGYTITPIEDAITDDNGDVTISFGKPGTYHITAIGSEDMEDYGSYVVMPYYTVNVVEDDSVANVYDDLWLQYDFKELKKGDSAEIYPRRVNQINKSDVAPVADVVRPNFNFEIISGDSIKLSANDSSQKVSVKAVKEGTTIVKVSYDPVFAYDKVWAGTHDSNVTYVVFDVNSNPADINIESGIDLSSYDTIYYIDEKELEFAPTCDEGQIFKVTANNETLTSEDGKYSFKLKEGANVIGITAQDEEGKFKTLYKVVKARKVSYTVTNLSREGEDIYQGDEVEIKFNGISLPVYKLAGIYNPTMFNPSWGAKGSFVSYYVGNAEEVTYVDGAGKDAVAQNGEVKGFGEQYNITDNSMILKFNAKGTYTFTKGSIFESWWGSGLGADKLVENGGKPNLDAPVLEKYFSELPEFKLEVKDVVPLLKKEIEDLNSQIETLNGQIEDLNTELDSANGSKEVLTAQLETAKENLEKAQADLEKYTKDKEASDAELEKVKTDLAKATKELEAAKATATKSSETKDSKAASDDKELVKKIVKFANSNVAGLKVKRGKKQAKLSWKAVDNADGYIIYRKVGKGKFKKVKEVSSKTLKFTNKKLKKKKTYTYKVVAFMNVDDSKVFSLESKTKKIKIKK
ncbi:hypothetical protein SAMN02745111_00417 [Eubacterium uniforme]|uniref:Fibronectin type-III domain-containing protein n=2 Tax=Eubacterium uniforme TaxID=39495 RepID=A0A1T4V8D6_9FIRM|nr:hypothetical protein SAMN02745111_00417 [Eubacterium uniforme]